MKTTTWFEEHLTDDNQKFMRKDLAEEYKRQTADKLNPLKDEPWPRHEWTEGRCRQSGRYMKIEVSKFLSKVIIALPPAYSHLVLVLGFQEVAELDW